MATLPPGDSFKASKKVCDLVATGVGGIFGPVSTVSADHIQSVSVALHVPHLETRWHYSFTRPDFSINLHPHPERLGKAFADYVRAVGWKSLAILYEKEEGLVRLQELIKLPKTFDDSIKITLVRLDDTGDFRPILKRIKNEESRIVIDIEFDKIQQILNQAREVGMINDYYNYLFTSLDLDKVTLPYENVNITGFRLVDQSSPAALRYLKKYPNTGRGKTHSLFSTNALMYDAVHVYARAMNDLGTLQTIETQPLSCEQEGVVWEDGEKILGFLKDVEMVGLTGEIR